MSSFECETYVAKTCHFLLRHSYMHVMVHGSPMSSTMLVAVVNTHCFIHHTFICTYSNTNIISMLLGFYWLVSNILGFFKLINVKTISQNQKRKYNYFITKADFDHQRTLLLSILCPLYNNSL